MTKRERLDTRIHLLAELEKLSPRTPLIEEMIAEAKAGEYHDYKNKKYACGKVAVVEKLSQVGTPEADALRKRVIDGDFDEGADEEDLAEMRKTVPRAMWPVLGLDEKKGGFTPPSGPADPAYFEKKAEVKEFKPFDPKLRAAMADIEKVLQKYNVGGQVDLVSKTHAEFRLFAPKWAPHTKDLKKGMFIWHLRKDNPDGNRHIVHFLDTCRELAGNAFMVLNNYMEWIEKHYEVTRTRGPVVRSPEDLGGGDDDGGSAA